MQREVFAPARGRGIGVGFVTLLFVVCMGSIVPACETDDGGGDGGAGGAAAGGTGGGGEAGAGGTGGDGGGGGSGGTGGAGGEESECASICATLLACPMFGDEGGGDDQARLQDCIRDCEGFSEAQRTCVTEVAETCDWDAVEACFEEEGSEEECEVLCDSVAACSANPDDARENCLFDCTFDWVETPGLVDCLKDEEACSEEWTSCFDDKDPACAALCDRVLYGCGIFATDTRSVCVEGCTNWWTEDERTCVESLDCDGDYDACFE